MNVKKRHIGLDILRIISMVMIVTLHYINKGGFQNIFEITSANYWIVKIIYHLSLVAVNCYVLISGYFLTNSKFKLRNILLLWGETLFWSIFISGIFILIGYRDKVDILKTFLPITTKDSYWFITTYICLYALFPILNLITRNISRIKMKILIVFLVIVFSLWKSVLPFAGTLDETGGYGIIWFCVLYLIASYIKMYGGIIKNHKLKIYILSTLITIFVKIGLKCCDIEALKNYTDVYGNYNTITVLIASIALFEYFVDVSIDSTIISKSIVKISSLTLGVYLIHEQLILRKFLWKNIIPCQAIANNNLFILWSAAIILGVFAVCILLEQIRMYITNKCGIHKICVKISDIIENKFKEKCGV